MYIEILKIAAAVGVSELAGVIGSLFTFKAIPTWYAGLKKGPLNPPSWVFGPVWTTLYLLMGIAAYLVFRKGFDFPGVKTALTVFIFQLCLNSLWSIIFFGLKQPQWALAEIVILWLAILVNMILFYKIVPAAGLLMVPYILWVTFASFLNYNIWTLNR